MPSTPLSNGFILANPPPEFKFSPACGNILENGSGVMVSGMTFGFREIDEVGGSFKELVDVLAEIENEQKQRK